MALEVYKAVNPGIRGSHAGIVTEIYPDFY